MIAMRWAAPGGQQRIDRAHSEVERFGDATAVEDVAPNPVQRPDATRDDRPLAVERLAHRVDDTADEPSPTCTMFA